MNKPEYIILHHTGGTESDPTADTSNHTFEDVDAWHASPNNPNAWPDFISKLGFVIGYHWFIDKQGKITQGRDELERSAHVVGMNESSIGICLAGNFDRLPALPNSKPTEAQVKSLKDLLKAVIQRHNIPRDRIVGHRYFANRTCPGHNIPNDWGQKLVEEVQPGIIELQKEQITLIQQIIATLKLLIIRMQNRLGGQKYA